MALLEQEGGLPKGYTATRANAHRNMRGLFHNRGSLPVHRGMMSNVGMTRGSPHLSARGELHSQTRNCP